MRRRRDNRDAEDRGAEGAEGVGVGCGPRNSVLVTFWALYFTIQLPVLRTKSGYIHVEDRNI